MENFDNYKHIIFILATVYLLYVTFKSYKRPKRNTPVQEHDLTDEKREDNSELDLEIYYLGKYCKDMNITIQDLQKITSSKE